MRRFTRLTNGFSKKVENHAAAVALHFMHYNFCRVHQTLRVTPAMEAGLSDHVWSLGRSALTGTARCDTVEQERSMYLSSAIYLALHALVVGTGTRTAGL